MGMHGTFIIFLPIAQKNKMAVELDEETIDVMKKVKDSLKDTSFDINRFEVGNTGADGIMITLDIRRHIK